MQVSNLQYYDQVYDPTGGCVASVYIRADKMYDSYNRHVLDLLTFMGSVGGLFETLKFLGILIFGVFA